MSFQYDPNQQGQFPAENNGNGVQGQQPQGLPQQQPGLQQGQESGSPAPFAQQGGVDGSAGSAAGDAKTTLWYVSEVLSINLRCVCSK